MPDAISVPAKLFQETSTCRLANVACLLYHAKLKLGLMRGIYGVSEAEELPKGCWKCKMTLQVQLKRRRFPSTRVPQEEQDA